MSKCGKCGQKLPVDPRILDALGREVGIRNVILWLKPVTMIFRKGVRIVFDDPIRFEPVVVYLDEIQTETIDKSYRIVGRTETGNPIEITGELGVPDPYLYKIADSVTDLI
jgi:hypothetical protein